MSQKITLVDDDKNITASVSLALKSEGFDVTVYNDSVEGLEGINAAPPELARRLGLAEDVQGRSIFDAAGRVQELAFPVNITARRRGRALQLYEWRVADGFVEGFSP